MNKTVRYDKDIRDVNEIKENYNYLIEQLNTLKQNLNNKSSNENEKITKLKITNISQLQKTILSLGKYEKKSVILKIVESYNLPIDLDETVYQTKQDAIQVEKEILEMEKRMKMLQSKKEKLSKKTSKFENENFEAEADESLNNEDDEDVVSEEKEMSPREQHYHNLRNN